MEKNDQQNLLTPNVEEFLRRYEIHKVHVEFIERLTLLVIAGFGLIAALAWDDVFRTAFDVVFPKTDPLISKSLYALVTTFLAVFITVILSKLFKKKSKK